MDGATRDALLARFAAYLDAADPALAPGDDGAPEGAPEPDLFTLLAELQALKTEVRLESRQVKDALDGFRDAFELARVAQTRLEDEQARRVEAERRTAQDAERGFLLELLDLRDRLAAGRERAAAWRPGWLARFGGAATFVSAMADGQAMSLRRFDEILARRGLRPVQALGNRFDPQTMSAAETARDPARPDGTVLAELRPGWLQGERLLRPAEVVVNRAAVADR